MKELKFDPREFEEHLGECHADVQEIVAYLRNTAKHAGADVLPRPYVPKTGLGITYYRGDDRFCQFHPKHRHVQALIDGVDPAALEAAGFAPVHRTREDKQPWVPIASMRDAVRLVPFILEAAGPDVNRSGAP